MKKRIELTLDFDIDPTGDDFRYLKNLHPGLTYAIILSKSLDARGANRGKKPRYTYVFDGFFHQSFKDEDYILHRIEENPGLYEERHLGPLPEKPIIIGAGPMGLFTALKLMDYGIPSIIFERGERATDRMKTIAKFWRYGEFHEESNVCFGEGGAGLFSDGKLITRIKSPWIHYVMKRLVDFGAPKEILYLSNPHLGSNKIRVIINKISDYLVAKGCTFYFQTKVEELIFAENLSHELFNQNEIPHRKITGVKTSQGVFYSEHVILGVGHSAKDMYRHLAREKVAMAQKNFAVGVRIEHPRKHIDSIQYGDFCQYAELGASRYRLSHEDPKTHKGTYSFCMCPGGYVLSSGTEANGIVVNGMSNYSRSGPWSNSALVVSVESTVDFSTEHILNGAYFQEAIEQKAYAHSREFASGKELPAQNVFDFLDGVKGRHALPHSSTPSGLVEANIHTLLPQNLAGHLLNALLEFEHKLPGFVSKEGILIAPETRTSAPVTVLRDRITLESINTQGLYPGGEGAGHAGGITSAAVDGVKIALSIIHKEKHYAPNLSP